MYDTTINIFTFLFLFSKMNFGHGCESLPPCVYDACERITDPEYLTTACCPQMDTFVDIINQCKGDSLTISSCEQATCVLERYRVITDGEVDFRKVERTIKELDALNPDQKSLNALVKKYCVQSNYTCFPSEDPYCPNWKFMNCAFFAYRIGCPIRYEENADCVCGDIAEDVATCKSFQRRYIREINRGCDICVAPPPRVKVPEFVEFVEPQIQYNFRV